MRIRTACVMAAAVLLATLPAGVAAAAAPGYGIPAPTGGLSVASLMTGRISLAKADGLAFMPEQTLRVYAYESSVRRGGDTVSTSRSWIVRKTGADPTYGVFAPVTVDAHAGTSAVEATISQVQLVDPVSSTYLPLGITTRIDADAGSTSTVRGSTLLRVTALRVDGAAVDVGSGCVSASALDLTIKGNPGFSDLDGGVLTGTFTVPAFTGCDTATAGTSALLTRALSGRGNTVILARGRAGSWDTTAPRDCRDCGRPPAIP